MAALLTCRTAQGRDVAAPLESYLTPALREQSRRDAIAWIKSLRLVPYDGMPMRRRFRFRHDSLWWFTELYLHKMRQLDAGVQTILALEAARDAHQPTRMALTGAGPAACEAARAFGFHHGMGVDVARPGAGRRSLRWQSYEIGLSARLSRMRQSALPVDRRPSVAAFVHTAFWRELPSGAAPGARTQESYVGAVLDAVAASGREGDLYCVGVGPRRNFRTRRWWDPVASFGAGSRSITPIERLAPFDTLRESLDLWRRRRALARDLTSGDAIHDAAAYRGCDLWPILKHELEAVACLQWPWSARAMDEAGAALEALYPGAVVTYAEAGGWGRALVLEARRRSIPSIGLQHGFIYRHWLNYLHEPDEIAPLANDRGCPIPDRTLLFDRYAEQHLATAGAFPAGTLAVTGNARLDDLVAATAARRASRDDLRHGLGVTQGQALAVLTAKYTEIRGSLADLVAALTGLPDLRLVIKPHPAEHPSDYDRAIAGAANVAVAPGLDLASLLAAADLVVTMNSTVAIDALVLGLPALVIGLPNNLSPFVEAGAMAGAGGIEAIRQALRSLLYDREARRRQIERGAAFARTFGLESDGRAASRAAAEILAMAGHPADRRHGVMEDTL
ncbi:MAG TPA: hypothetical protein VFV78_10275 [Vicinamibacterales bacterium]|nr:hypothetical protein [Vicinamibacterales bacterium]